MTAAEQFTDMLVRQLPVQALKPAAALWHRLDGLCEWRAAGQETPSAPQGSLHWQLWLAGKTESALSCNQEGKKSKTPLAVITDVDKQACRQLVAAVHTNLGHGPD